MSDRKEKRGGGARSARADLPAVDHFASRTRRPSRPRPVRGGGGLRDGAPVSALLRTDGGPLGRELRGSLRGCGRKSSATWAGWA